MLRINAEAVTDDDDYEYWISVETILLFWHEITNLFLCSFSLFIKQSIRLHTLQIYKTWWSLNNLDHTCKIIALLDPDAENNITIRNVGKYVPLKRC